MAWLLLAGATAFTSTSAAGAPDELPSLVQTISMPDVRGRIDHLDIDVEGGRLFVAALGNDSVEVIDLRAGRRSARVEHLLKPQGVAYVPGARRLFVANGSGARLDVLAGDTLSVAGRVDGLDDADNVRHERGSGRVYVGYGAALAVVEGATTRLTKRIKLAGHPESFQLESNGSRIFVNVPDARQVAVIDRNKAVVVNTWTLPDLGSNFPMALDESRHRLFIATRRPAALLVLDTETGKQVASVPIGGDSDDLFFDPDRRQVLAICGEGVISIVEERGADNYAAVGQVSTAPGARTGLFVPAQRMLYVAVPAQRSKPAEIRVYKLASGASLTRLSSSEIRAEVVGKTVTDESHWSDHLLPDGALQSFDMGHPKSGSWKIDGNELCLTRKERKGMSTDCFEVWLAKNRIELRRDGVTVVEGVLRDK